MHRKTILPGLCALFACAPAMGQAPILSESATQPAKGRWLVREQFRLVEYGHDPTGAGRDVREFSATTTLDYGLTGSWSLSLRAPLTWRDIDTPGGEENQSGINDLTALTKWRVWQDDPGPTDTSRVSLLFGAEFESPDDDFNDGSVHPVVGVTATHIRGRHGVGGGLTWTATTGGSSAPIGPGDSTADWLRADASYLFRISPDEYRPDTHGALYGVVEVNTNYETNGDTEVFLSPGVMYEAQAWTLEAAVQIPVAQDMDHRPETDWVVVFGVRLLF